MTGAGDRDRLITFQRATVSEDDYGGEEPIWGELEQAWAKVRFGSSQERREAAMEQASQVATFRVLSTTNLRTVTAKDRISWNGVWDITGPGVPVGGEASEIEFTAIQLS